MVEQEITLEKVFTDQELASLNKSIFDSKEAQTPIVGGVEEEEVRSVIKRALDLTQQLEAKASPHGEIHQDTDVVWVVSGPGAYSLTIWPFEDKADHYRDLPWTRKMDRHRLRTGAALVHEITAKRTGKKVEAVTREDIRQYGPWFMYNATEAENQHVKAVLDQESVKIPPEKLFIYHEFKDESGETRQIVKTIDQIQGLRFPEGGRPRRVAVVSHAPHLMRLLHMLGKYPDRGPEGAIVQPFPIKTPKEGRLAYPELETKGLLYYIFQAGVAAKEPYPYHL